MGDRVSAEAIERNRVANRERARLRRLRMSEQEHEDHLQERRLYREKNKEHFNELWNLRYGANVEKFRERPFIGWDSEGYTTYKEDLSLVWADDRVRQAFTEENRVSGDHHCMLFGCSLFPGNPLTGRDLSTKECLEYLLYVERQCPDAFHVGFAFDYDVNMILRDLPSRTLRHLAVYGICHWEGYRIKYIRGKLLCVSGGRKPNRTTITVYDVFSFFNSSYVVSLLKFAVTTKENLAVIEEGKKNRSRFTFEDIEYVKRYWQEEISYFPLLMDQLREAAYDAGLYITQWHGSGSLATYILRKRGVRQWKSKSVPTEAQIAIQHAYAGGRFQPWQCGLLYHDIYTADINSAYIYACSLLPRLDNGCWRRIPAGMVDRENIARFGVYYIAFDAGKDKPKQNRSMGAFQEIYPLFHRDKHNQVRWPRRTEGWYWSPEAKLVRDNPDARFLEAWIYDDDGSRPFEWVHTEFDKRLALQHEGNPAEKTFKWALAAMYGAFARRVGWDQKNRRPPGSHELAWAGFITSWCRAEMYKVAYECWRRGGLISIDTDGVTSSVPFEDGWLDRGVGEKLGQWKLEKYAGILYWQTGFYWLLDKDGNWSTAKTRGIPRGTVHVSIPLTALENADYRHKKPAVIMNKKTTFTGFKEALNRGNLGLAFRWETAIHKAKMGGGSTYHHVWLFCKKCRNPDLDIMHYLTHFEPLDPASQPHDLPWLHEEARLHPMFETEDDLPIVLDTDIPSRL